MITNTILDYTGPITIRPYGKGITLTDLKDQDLLGSLVDKEGDYEAVIIIREKQPE